MKRRTTKEIIEGEPNPRVEHAYIKYPRQEPIPVTKSSDERRVKYDRTKIRDIAAGKLYSDIHTHVIPYAMPSVVDFSHFLTNKNE